MAMLVIEVKKECDVCVIPKSDRPQAICLNISHFQVGPVGTGKTSVATSVLAKLDPKLISVLTVNLSAQVNRS